MARKFKSMDGNNAAAYVSYAFTEVAGIYPITPSSPMADLSTSGPPLVRRTFSAPLSRSSRCSPRRVPPARSTAPWPPVR